MTETTSSPKLSLPVAIIIAGVLIAGAVFFTQSNGAVALSDSPLGKNNTPQTIPAENLPNFRGVSEDDHIFGSLDAPVSIIEFSDYECPYCQLLHPTLQKIVAEYPSVNWIYRHFPLSGHANALGSSIAAECVAKLEGNDAFWTFTSALFANQATLSDVFYKSVASDLGIDAAAFAACQAEPGIADLVREDLNEIVSVGGSATPSVIIVTASGKYLPFTGALEYDDIAGLIDFALEN